MITTIDQLVLGNQPDQFRLLSEVTATLTKSTVVTDLAVRGSIAHGRADRMSDVDFIVGVRDTDYPAFVGALDALMATELAALFPGWRDTIVAEMGGLGYVYLVATANTMRQVDMYVVPASQAEDARLRCDATAVFAAPPGDPAPGPGTSLPFIREAAARPRTCTEIIIEVLVLAHMISKRIRRGQRFVCYAQTNLLLSAVKDLIKTALVPTSRAWGWYHLEEDLAITPLGAACLGDLMELISGPGVLTARELGDILHKALDIARRVAPHSLDMLQPALDSYLHYLELA